MRRARDRNRHEDRRREKDQKAARRGSRRGSRWVKTEREEQTFTFERNLINLYFSDFSEEWKLGDMWKSFGAYGNVIDVFVPVKRAKNGSHFGFVRFKGVRDGEILRNRLKEMRVTNRRIFIKLALFRRPMTQGVQTEPGQVGHKGNQTISIRKAVASPPLRDNRRYAKELVDFSNLPGQGKKWERPEHIMADDVKAKDLKCLEGCAIGSVKSMDFLLDIPFILKEGGFLDTRAKYLGGFQYLLECDSAVEMAHMLLEGNEALLKWFEWVKPRHRDVETIRPGRLCWVNISGVPLHLWNVGTFKKLQQNGVKWWRSRI